jgi:hypothetical protein
MVTGHIDEDVVTDVGAVPARTPPHLEDKDERRVSVLYMTEEMIRRYCSPLAPKILQSLKIDGSRRAERIRQVSCIPLGKGSIHTALCLHVYLQR